jgi:hypothetical protein
MSQSPRNAQSPKPEAPIEFEGDLQKLGGVLGSKPQKRHFELRGFELYYYKLKDGKTEEKGVMDLRNTRTVDEPSHPHAWNIIGGHLKRPYTLIAQNEEQKQLWMAKLSNPAFQVEFPAEGGDDGADSPKTSPRGTVMFGGTKPLKDFARGMNKIATGLALAAANSSTGQVVTPSGAVVLSGNTPCGHGECHYKECKFFMKSGYCVDGHTAQCKVKNCVGYLTWVQLNSHHHATKDGQLIVVEAGNPAPHSTGGAPDVADPAPPHAKEPAEEPAPTPAEASQHTA